MCGHMRLVGVAVGTGRESQSGWKVWKASRFGLILSSQRMSSDSGE